MSSGYLEWFYGAGEYWAYTKLDDSARKVGRWWKRPGELWVQEAQPYCTPSAALTEDDLARMAKAT